MDSKGFEPLISCLRGSCLNRLAKNPYLPGAIRTHDHFVRSEALCPLSYGEQERPMGFEPIPLGWKPNVLTVKHHSRIFVSKSRQGIEPCPLGFTGRGSHLRLSTHIPLPSVTHSLLRKGKGLSICLSARLTLFKCCRCVQLARAYNGIRTHNLLIGNQILYH